MKLKAKKGPIKLFAKRYSICKCTEWVGPGQHILYSNNSSRVVGCCRCMPDKLEHCNKKASRRGKEMENDLMNGIPFFVDMDHLFGFWE